MTADPKIAKLQTDFQNLSEIASALNTASDHLTRSVAVLDEALKRLNIGLAVWVNFAIREVDVNEPMLYDIDQIGYYKVNGTWGLAIRHIWGDEGADWEKEEGPWLFNDASRELRVRAVDKIPEVITELTKVTLQTTKRVQEKTEKVVELAEAITQVTVATGKGKSLTLAERVAAGQKSLTGKLSDLAGPGKLGSVPARDTEEGSK
jgi:hypothetical protein